MRAELAKPLALLLAVVAVAILLGVVGQRLLGAVGPEAELITQLKTLERTGAVVKLAGGDELRLPKLQYQRMQVHVEPGGRQALVTCTLDATGDLSGRTTVSSLGLERVPFALVDGDWERTRGPAPRLVAIVTALEARRRLLEAGGPFPDGGTTQGVDVAQLLALNHRKVEAKAWYIRSERAEVLVSEDFQLKGDLPDRPVQDPGTRRLTLVEDATGEFRFPGGVR